MVQSNVIVTYAAAREAAAVVPERAAVKRGSRHIRLPLAGALLAGGAAFMLGTFVRPNGTIREPGTSPQQPTFAAAGRGAPSARIPSGLTVGGATPGTMDRAPPLPFLAVVQNAAPSPVAGNSAVRPLSAQVARDEVNRPRRTEQRESPAPGQGVPLAADLAAQPSPVPPAGQRRDLPGFLSQQGLVLAAETDSEPALAPVSEWTPGDFAAPADVPPSSASPEKLAGIAEAASSQGEFGAGSETSLTQLAVGPAAEATQVQQPAEAVPPGQTTPLETTLIAMPAARHVRAGAGPVAAEPASATDAQAGGHMLDAEPRLAAVSIAPVQTRSAAAAIPEAAHVQSFPLAVVNGETLGAVTLRDFGPAGATIHLGALVGLMKLQMPHAEFARLSSAPAADRFVTFDQLRAAGIAVKLDTRRDRLLIDVR